MESERLSEGHTQWCIVALSIYIASHFSDELRSPREIAAVTGVEADHIRESYDVFYPKRERLVRVDMLDLPDNFFEDGSSTLRWPTPGFELTDEQIENDDVWRMLRDGCNEGCKELGLVVEVAEFTIKVAGKLFTARLMVRLSTKEMVAVSIYMAAHMHCILLHRKRAAEVVGIRQSDVSSAYEIAYSYQHLLVGQQWLGEIGEESVERTLRRLPLP